MYRQLIAWLSVLLISALGCSATPHFPWQVKVTQAVGGDYQSVCLTEDYIALQSSFEVVLLQIDHAQNVDHQRPEKLQKNKVQTPRKDDPKPARLKVTRRVNLPQFTQVLTSSVDHVSDQDLSKVRLNPSSSQERLCPEEAWLPLGAQGKLHTHWSGRELIVTRHSWRWGVDHRERVTRVRDLASTAHRTSISRHTSKTSAHTRSYLLATERGLWRWTEGRTQALIEPLPDSIPQKLSRIVNDSNHPHGR